MSKEIKIHLDDSNVLTVSESGGSGITLKNSSGAMITVNDQGITLDNGKGAKITLTGPTIDFNSGALSVT